MTAGRQAPLVARTHEQAALTERLTAAATGHGGVVLLAGEPGIGKTRLLAELSATAREQGWTVLAGRAYEDEGLPPYLPFVEALRGYLTTGPPERLQAQLGAGAADVALLLLLTVLRGSGWRVIWWASRRGWPIHSTRWP